MKFIDAIGLKYFYDKLKSVLNNKADLNSKGTVPIAQLPDTLKKVKYIKKERRNLYHKRIPLCFDAKNPQINGRYDDWYYSKCPVFRVARNKKFRLFMQNYDGTIIVDNINFKEATLDSLTYWRYEVPLRVNLIEKSGDALICKAKSTTGTNNYVYICPSIEGQTVFPTRFAGYNIYKYSYDESTNTLNIYILWDLVYEDAKPQPWNKTLVSTGSRIESILPTSVQDVKKYLYCNSSSNQNIGIDNIPSLHNIKVRYYRHYCTKRSNKSVFRLVKRCLSGHTPLRAKTHVISVKANNGFKKQPSKFSIFYTKNNDSYNIKKI